MVINHLLHGMSLQVGIQSPSEVISHPNTLRLGGACTSQLSSDNMIGSLGLQSYRSENPLKINILKPKNPRWAFGSDDFLFELGDF